MTNSGKYLEALVAFVEETLLPQGFKITTNKQVVNDEGIQIAEFDIEVCGKVGSTAITWLIECRDRPSQGPAPGSWIEQLVGRRDRFNLNRVTAVSTTGFSEGAKEYAKDAGIELREVRELAPEFFADWILMKHMVMVKRLLNLHGVTFNIDPQESEDRIQAATNALKDKRSDSIFLRAPSGDMVSVNKAYEIAISGNPHLYEGIAPNQSKKVRFFAQYADNDQFTIETASGLVPIKEIVFKGELSLREILIPMQASEYKDAETGDIISQVASFPFAIGSSQLAFEMHKIPESGSTHVILRATPQEKT